MKATNMLHFCDRGRHMGDKVLPRYMEDTPDEYASMLQGERGSHERKTQGICLKL